MDLDPESIAKSPFTIGALGALVTAVKFTPGSNWPERIFNIVAGAMAAGFLTPMLTEYLRMTSPAYMGGAAFVCGLLSMSLAAALLQALRDLRLADIVSGWLTRR
jgi:hypothetical protein